MFRMRFDLVFRVVILALISCGGVAVSQADAQIIVVETDSPVVYQDTLLDGEVTSSSVSAQGDTTDPELAVFFSIFGSQGEDVTISVQRVESDLDPAFYVYEGLFADASEFGGAFNFDDRFLAFADDEVPSATGSGPFADPSTTITLPSEGVGAYTIAVVNFISGPDNGGDGRFDFTIQASGNLLPAAVPEPSSAIILSASGLVLLLRRRRTKN